MLIAGLVAYFVLLGFKNYHNPFYLSNTPIYDYSVKTAYMHPQLGNTITVWLGSLADSKMRVQFSYTDRINGDKIYVDAVWCNELYAK